jgi:chorismate dehydratase
LERRSTAVHRLGVVSFLNSRPLIAGLATDPRVELHFAVPARLPDLLDRGQVDAALIPMADILRRPGEYSLISDGCIACDGETMTVRVFSQLPPDRITTLWVDADSHTSVLLARVLWQALYGRKLELCPLSAGDGHAPPAILLIGDKVVDPQRGSFAYEVDLGGAWRQHTGLPFVFAAWATSVPHRADAAELAALLNAARDRGVAAAAEIAATEGPRHGWPAPLAERYLTRCLQYCLTERALAGARRFAELCAAEQLVPPAAVGALGPGVAAGSSA